MKLPQLKSYCVTVMDHWTSTRTFWTRKGAELFHDNFITGAYMWCWRDGKWVSVKRPDQNGRY